MHLKYSPSGGDALMTQVLDRCIYGVIRQHELWHIADAIDQATLKVGRQKRYVCRDMFMPTTVKRHSVTLSRPPIMQAQAPSRVQT